MIVPLFISSKGLSMTIQPRVPFPEYLPYATPGLVSLPSNLGSRSGAERMLSAKVFTSLGLFRPAVLSSADLLSHACSACLILACSVINALRCSALRADALANSSRRARAAALSSVALLSRRAFISSPWLERFGLLFMTGVGIGGCVLTTTCFASLSLASLAAFSRAPRAAAYAASFAQVFFKLCPVRPSTALSKALPCA